MTGRTEVYADGALVETEAYDLSLGEYTRTVSGEVVESRPLTPEEIEQHAPPDYFLPWAERAAIKRREREEAGITLTLPDGPTIQIPTGREDRAIMDGALLMLQSDPEREIRWKTSDGARIPVTYAELLAINSAVWEYVEACFDHEAELADDAEADLDVGWPSRERTLE